MRKTVPIIVVLAVALATGVSYTIHRKAQVRLYRTAHEAFEKQWEAARREHIPLETAQLQTLRPPADQDAGLIYDRLTFELKTPQLTGQDAILREGVSNRMPSNQERTQMEAALSRRADIVRDVHRAAMSPGCSLRIAWTKANPSTILFTQFTTIREAARILAEESFTQASQGHIQKAVQTQALCFRLADHAMSGKTTIAMLTGIAIDEIALSGMRRILYLTHGDPVAAAMVRKAVASNYHSPQCSEALRADTAMNASEIRFLRTIGPEASLALLFTGNTDSAASYENDIQKMDRQDWSAYLDINGALILQYSRGNIAAVDQPYPTAIRLLTSNEAALERRFKASHRYLIAMMLTADPTIGLRTRKAFIDSDVAVIEASAQMLMDKSKTHVFPEDLPSSLGNPMDAFTLQPLHYKREGEGFALWSVGETGTFDGGDRTVKPKTSEPLFRFPAPEYYWKPQNNHLASVKVP